MIIVTELGDKTFFIAAIMAMRHPRLVVYLSAMLALALMTVLSAMIGFALPSLMPRKYTHWASTALFVYFGFKLLSDAYAMGGDAPSAAKEELEEVEQELAEKDGDVEEGTSVITKTQMAIFIQGFTMTFLAEWGDRSQIATIALASAKDPYGVTLGGVIGHGLITGVAVIGGRLLATRISEVRERACVCVSVCLCSFSSVVTCTAPPRSLYLNLSRCQCSLTTSSLPTPSFLPIPPPQRTVAISGGLLFWVFAVHSMVTGPSI